MTEQPDNPQARPPERRRWLEIIGLVVGVIGILVGVLEILPDDAGGGGTPTATPTPTRFTDSEIGVVVSYFVPAPGAEIDPAQARDLIDGVYATLIAELDDFRDQLDIGLGSLPPSSVAPVQGSTRAERERNAMALAASTGAEIVLYGEIARGANGALDVQPEFYVAPDVFADALELTGAYRLGSEIPVEIPINVDANTVLTGRTTAAAQIFAGLVFYVTDQFALARRAFEDAAAQPGWETTEGREVLNILLGNTYGKLAGVAAQSGDLETASTHLREAMAQYEGAVAINAELARAYNGMASALYLGWNIDFQANGASDQAGLITALDWLARGADAIDQPEEIAVRTKPLFTELQISYALWTFHIDQYTNEQLDGIERDIRRDAQQIIRRYDDGGNPSLQAFASEAHGYLGLIAYSQSACPDAIPELTAALELALSDVRRMFFSGWMGDCYELMNQDEAAINAYLAAIEYAEAMDEPPSEQIERYQALVDELRGNG
jgi:tetratricopeptide (TPR) repeat protein